MSRPTPEEIASAWAREIPGAPTESILLITPLWRVAKLLEDERRRVLASLGVDAGTLDLLSTLRRAGTPFTLTTREITSRALITAGAVSQRVARAERHGLVTRASSIASRRAVAVTLTDAGSDLVANTVRALLAHERGLIADLTEPEKKRLRRLLRTWETTLIEVRQPVAEVASDIHSPS